MSQPDENPDGCERCAELAAQVEQLAAKLEAVQETAIDAELRLDDLDDAVAENTATVESHATRLSDVESRLASSRTERSGREEALHDALVRQAVSRGGPVRLWWRELKDLAVSLGYPELTKPVWSRHIDSLAETFAGFEKTTKQAAMDDRDERRDVKAIGVDPDQLPVSVVQDNGNEVTTVNDTGASENTDQPTEQPSDD